MRVFACQADTGLLFADSTLQLHRAERCQCFDYFRRTGLRHEIRVQDAVNQKAQFAVTERMTVVVYALPSFFNRKAGSDQSVEIITDCCSGWHKAAPLFDGFHKLFLRDRMRRICVLLKNIYDKHQKQKLVLLCSFRSRNIHIMLLPVYEVGSGSACHILL